MHVGYNIRDRKSSGLRLFNKNRLIVDIDGKSWAKWPLGVIASVDVPASLMQPSMSKQRFSDDREFRLAFKKHYFYNLYNLVFFKNCVLSVLGNTRNAFTSSSTSGPSWATRI